MERGFTSTQRLGRTYLPFPKLKSLVTEYCVPYFVFVSMSPHPNDEDIEEWEFLDNLEIGIHDTVLFYVSALEMIGWLDVSAIEPDGTVRLKMQYSDCIIAFRKGVPRIMNEHRKPSAHPTRA